MSEQNPPAAAEGNSVFSPRILRILAWSAGAYFLLRLIYFTIAIHHSAPPDEITHLNRVAFFSQFAFLPSGVPGDGESHLWSTRFYPSLYYILAGKFLLLNFFSFSDIFMARLFSVVLGCLTVFYGWRFIKLLSPKPLVHLLFLFMLTNTLMFSFLSAAVTYDSLVNLLAAASIYYMTCYFQRRDGRSLLCLLISLALATLTKVTMLPFAFAIVVGVLIHGAWTWKQGQTRLGEYRSAFANTPKSLFVCVALLLGLNALLYGNNLIRYGHLVPRAEQVLSESDIKSHPMAARATLYVGYLKGEHSLEEALEKAKEIEDPASSLDTQNLLKFGAWRKEHEGPFVPMSRLAYAARWSKTMLFSTYGVLGHTVAFKPLSWNLLYVLVFVVSGAFFVVRGFQGRADSYEFLYLGMFVFYALVLMQLVNYKSYLDFQLPHISVQGRYLFPFIVPVYGLTAKYLLSFGTARLQAVVAVVVAIFYVYGDFPFFLSAWGNGPW